MQIGPMRVTYPAGTVFYTNDIVVVRVLQQNLGRRPIVWALTTGGEFAGLDRNVIQRGMGMPSRPQPIDTTAPGVDPSHVLGAPLDVPATETLAWQIFRYADLLTRGDRGARPDGAGHRRQSLPAVHAAGRSLRPGRRHQRDVARQEPGACRRNCRPSPRWTSATLLSRLLRTVRSGSRPVALTQLRVPAGRAGPSSNSSSGLDLPAMLYPGLADRVPRVRAQIAEHQARRGWTHPVRSLRSPRPTGPRRCGRGERPGSTAVGENRVQEALQQAGGAGRSSRSSGT